MTSTRQTLPGRLSAALLIPAVLVLLAFGLLGANAGAATANPVVKLSLPTPARVGQTLVVEIVADQVRNVAGYQADIGLGAGLELVGGGAAEGLRANGRDLLSFGPIEHDGTATLGAASCPSGGCSVANARKAAKIPNGVSGRVVLGRLELLAGAPGQYTLDLRNVKLVDPQGNLLSAAVQSITLTVTP